MTAGTAAAPMPDVDALVGELIALGRRENELKKRMGSAVDKNDRDEVYRIAVELTRPRHLAP